MVYTLLFGPMVYTLFPCFPRKMVYIIVFCSVTRARRGATVVVCIFPWEEPLSKDQKAKSL